MRLYFDANALIRSVEATDSASDKLRKIIDLAEDGGCEIVTSELSLMETMVGPLKALRHNPKDAEALARERLYRSFGAWPDGVQMKAIDRDLLLRAAVLRATRDMLKLPDAIHLATEMSTGCDVLVSGDKRLRVVALAVEGRRGSTCSIEEHELGALNFRLGIT